MATMILELLLDAFETKIWTGYVLLLTSSLVSFTPCYVIICTGMMNIRVFQ